MGVAFGLLAAFQVIIHGQPSLCRSLTGVKVFLDVLNPYISVKRYDRRMAEEEVHAANEHVSHSLVVEFLQNAVDVEHAVYYSRQEVGRYLPARFRLLRAWNAGRADAPVCAAGSRSDR